MMSKTGNNFSMRYALCAWHKAQRAFTLVEVMIAAAVLSLGTVLVNQSFLGSLDSVSYYSNYLGVIPWADEKVWQVQDALSHNESLPPIERSGEFKKSGKVFNWNLGYGFVDEESRLYKIDLAVAWQEGNRKVRLLRTAYAMYNDKK